MAEPRITYEEYMAHLEEMVRRAKIIKNRVEKMEFTSAPAQTDEEKVTAGSSLYAALELCVIHGIPCSVVVQIVGMFYMIAEHAASERLMDNVRNHLIMHGPSKGSVM